VVDDRAPLTNLCFSLLSEPSGALQRSDRHQNYFARSGGAPFLFLSTKELGRILRKSPCDDPPLVNVDENQLPPQGANGILNGCLDTRLPT
jgi:hypothetical protein